MTLVRKNAAPYFPAVLDELLNTDWLGGREQHLTKTTPAVNVIEKDDAFTLQVAAPGLKKEDFSIEIDADVLTVSTQHNEAEEQKESGKFTRREFRFTSFKRSFNLPDTVNTAEIHASYESGVLNIGLPKREEAVVQPARYIEIK